MWYFPLYVFVFRYFGLLVFWPLVFWPLVFWFFVGLFFCLLVFLSFDVLVLRYFGLMAFGLYVGSSRNGPGGSGRRCLWIFEILLGFMGPFSGPLEIADRSKIVLLSIDGHFDPRKMPSGRGFGKNMKNCMKNRCQNRRFLMAQNHVWRYTLRL